MTGRRNTTVGPTPEPPGEERERGMVRTSSKASFFGVFRGKDKEKEIKKKTSTEELAVLNATREKSGTTVNRVMSHTMSVSSPSEMHPPAHSHSFGGEIPYRGMMKSSSVSPDISRKKLMSTSCESNPVFRVAPHEPTNVFDNQALWDEEAKDSGILRLKDDGRGRKGSMKEEKKEKKDKKSKGSLKDSLSRRFKKNRSSIHVEGETIFQNPLMMSGSNSPTHHTSHSNRHSIDSTSGAESPSSPSPQSRMSPSSSGPIFALEDSSSSDSPSDILTGSILPNSKKVLVAPRKNSVLLPTSSDKETFRQGKVVFIQKFSSITDLISAAGRDRKSLQLRPPGNSESSFASLGSTSFSSFPTNSIYLFDSKENNNNTKETPPSNTKTLMKIKTASKDNGMFASSPGLKGLQEAPDTQTSNALLDFKNSLRRTKSLPTNMTLEEQNAVLSRITWEQTNRPMREKDKGKDWLSLLSDELTYKILEYSNIVEVHNFGLTNKIAQTRIKNPEIWLRLLKIFEQTRLKPSKDKPLWEDVGLPTVSGENLVLTFSRSENDVNNKLTLNQLVTKLTPGATTVVDSDDYGAFLATYKSFTTPQNLVRKLVERYHVPNPLTTDEKELTEFKRMTQKPIQLRVCRIMKTIVDNHFDDLDEDTIHYIGLFIRGMMALGDNFYRSLVVSYEKKSTSHKIVQLQLVPSVSSSNSNKSMGGGSVSVRMKTKKVVDSKQKITIRNELELLEVKGTALAEQLTLIEFELFRNIRTEEFASIEGKGKAADPTAGMPQFIAHFNDISRWVQEEILAEEKLKPRARRVEKFIKLAHQLREMNNFETLMAITSSIGDTAIHRLTQTRNEVQPQYWKMLEDLQDLMSSEKSYSKYRNAIRDVIEHGFPCIPYIGVYRRDLIYHEEGQKSNGAINFGKSRQIFSIIQEIKNFQGNSYQLRVHPSVNSKLRCLPPLPNGVTHEEYKKTVLWQLSLQREARSANRASVMF